jgi:hypothetical protein
MVLYSAAVVSNKSPKHLETLKEVETAVEEVAVLLNRDGLLLKEPWDQSWAKFFYSFKRSKYNKKEETAYSFLNETFFNDGFEGIQSDELSEALLEIYSNYGENISSKGGRGWSISKTRQEEVYSSFLCSGEKYKSAILLLAERAVGRLTTKRVSDYLPLRRT